MSSKRCFKCGDIKPLSEFYVHREMGDGHLNKCKQCARKDATRHRGNKLDEYRAYDRARGNRQSRSYIGEYRKRFPNKHKAHQAVASALKSGAISAEPCFVCGGKAEAHHPDYDAPLSVVWLCPPHHKQAHALVRKSA